jgi:hypothetical protein
MISNMTGFLKRIDIVFTCLSGLLSHENYRLWIIQLSIFTAFLDKNGQSKIYQITSKITEGILDDVKFTREVRQI